MLYEDQCTARSRDYFCNVVKIEKVLFSFTTYTQKPNHFFQTRGNFALLGKQKNTFALTEKEIDVYLQFAYSEKIWKYLEMQEIK